MKSCFPFVSAVMAILFLSCAGGAGSMTFNNLKYQVALTSSLDIDGKRYDSNNLAPGQKVVIEKQLWSLVYTAWDLNSESDLSDTLNQTIDMHRGVAMRNVRITAAPCGIAYAMPLTWIWFFPSCTQVTIEGEVVQQP